MWIVKQYTIQMAESDYGLELPVTVDGTTLTSSDTLRFTFSDQNENPILVKEYVPVNNTASLEFTSSESALFHTGIYVYSLDWYQNGNFMCNIIPIGLFKVVDKV